MSKKLYMQMRKRHQAEEGGIIHAWGGRLTVALVYPNTYHNAMSNLGFLSVHHWLNQRDDTLCERFFLPDPDALADHKKGGVPLFSIESERQLAEFDVIAFSISFENDYLNLPILFDLGRIPWGKIDRTEQTPLLLAGGVCAFLNPEPLAQQFDLFAVGEAEAILPNLIPGLIADTGRSRDNLLRLSNLPGIYAPVLYEPRYDTAGVLLGWDKEPAAPFPVERQWLADLDSSACRSYITTPDTEFGDMALTEISRGCGHGCRFCAAGFIFRPPRFRSLAAVEKQIDLGLCQHKKQGLVSPAVGDYPQLNALQKGILAKGGSVSVASLRIDTLTAADVEALSLSGHKTVALAPEAGSQRLRDAIHKRIDTKQILHAVKLLSDGGVPNLKLYFLIGLPGETAADLVEMLELVSSIRAVWLEAGRKKGWLGQIHLSVNPFVPKPFTPFQWAAMATEADLKKKMKQLRLAIGKIPNLSISFESARAALLQGFLSRGGREVGRLLPELASGERYLQASRKHGVDWREILHTEKSADAVFPWEVIDCRVDRDLLWREWEQAQSVAQISSD
ncbi:MAG: radical SAM protein [Desulfuromonadales bacterium]|nr:radical SAM protein [Desulfuromonadales bacterium]